MSDRMAKETKVFSSAFLAKVSQASKSISDEAGKPSSIASIPSSTILSKIKFEKPNTVSVPILVSRLQAGAGLINVGSVVDIYLNSNYTNESVDGNTSPDVSGCTVLSIMRYEDNGEIDSEYSKSKMNIKGNDTYPQENTKSFSSNVLELLKGSIIKGYDEEDAFRLTYEGVAPAGHSEHQTGLAVDIVSYYHQSLDAAHADTKEAIWLKEHCKEYGFIVRYMEGKEDITHRKAESWHFRYVGVEAATYIMENDITLEEYLEEYITNN